MSASAGPRMQMATAAPKDWPFVDPSTLGLNTVLDTTHSYCTYLATHTFDLTEDGDSLPSSRLLESLPEHYYATRLAKTLKKLEDDARGRKLYCSYGGQVSPR